MLGQISILFASTILTGTKVERKQVDVILSLEHMYGTIENEIYCVLLLIIIHAHPVYSNLTGWYHLYTYSGMKYICVCFVYKLNTIIL